MSKHAELLNIVSTVRTYVEACPCTCEFPARGVKVAECWKCVFAYNLQYLDAIPSETQQNMYIDAHNDQVLGHHGKTDYQLHCERMDRMREDWRRSALQAKEAAGIESPDFGSYSKNYNRYAFGSGDGSLADAFEEEHGLTFIPSGHQHVNYGTCDFSGPESQSSHAGSNLFDRVVEPNPEEWRISPYKPLSNPNPSPSIPEPPKDSEKGTEEQGGTFGCHHEPRHEAWTMTNGLRFNGTILEQEWRDQWSGKTKWLSVPRFPAPLDEGVT